MQTLNDLLKHLHNARRDAEKAKETMKAVLDAAKEGDVYRSADLVREMAENDIQALEERIHQQGLAAYLETGEKTVNKFVKVREESVFTITDAAAMRTFVETRLPDALIVDEKKVKNYATKIGAVDGTTVTKEPKVTIATDLSEVENE